MNYSSGEITTTIPGPVGSIEAIISVPKDHVKSIVAVVCHPHPLQEGTMHNKVVTTLTRAFRDFGVTSIRFNFRGVGASEGNYADGIGETEDAVAVLEWARSEFGPEALWLAGFSFGGAVAYRAASVFDVSQLICVAPSVERVDVKVAQPECPILVVQGDADEVVLPGAVEAWVDGLETRPELVLVPGAGHFFHGRLAELKDVVVGLF